MAIATVTTRHQNLNVRAQPTINSAVIGKLGKGATIEVGSDVFSEGGWTWVTYGGGWVCQKDPRYSYPFLNIQPAPPEDVVEAPEEPPPPPPEPPDYSQITADLMSRFGDSDAFIRAAGSIPIDGSAVMYENEKYDADELWINRNWQANKNRGQMTRDQIASLDRKSPDYYQNQYGYPPVVQFNHDKGWYEYNYYMDYDRDNLSSDMKGLRETYNLGIEGRDELYRAYTENYNRFKIHNPNDALHKTFSHVFFVRPDCNVLRRIGERWELPDGLQSNPNFVYAYNKSPELLRQLISDAGYDHDFMLFLSNKARSFQLSDEFINYDTYGKANTGHKVAYGKTNVESKTAGDFSISYIDDRDLHVFHIHKLWTDYISNVYQGVFDPKEEYMINKILDYVANVYYIMTAEDGETVIFWSKYYGVFPVSIPSSQYSWAAGNVLTAPEFDVKYQYSFKEDFNPLSLVEFNMNSGSTEYSYIPIISRERYTTNTTWVGAPFIETFNNDSLAPYTFKLRFRRGDV